MLTKVVERPLREHPGLFGQMNNIKQVVLVVNSSECISSVNKEMMFQEED